MKLFPPDEPKRPHPFAAPEGYFNDLPARIQQRVNGSAAQNPRLVPRWAYVAASVLVLAAVSVWLITRPVAPTSTPAAALSAEQLLTEVPTETLVNYLLLTEVDVVNTTALSEAEQAELLEELDAGDQVNEFLNHTSDDEN